MAMKAKGGRRMPRPVVRTGKNRSTSKKGNPGGRYANTRRPSGNGSATR